jgi:hypothetical protein
MRQVIICRCHRGPAGALRRDAPLKAERAGELAAERFRSQAGDPGAGGIEPLAERFGACAAGRPPPRCLPASRRALTMALRTTGTTTVTRNARLARLGPVLARPHQAPAGAGQRGRDALSGPRWPAGVNQNMTSAAVTAATAKTSLQITCPRRDPEPAAITAKTARMGLEITAAVRAFSLTSLVAQRDACGVPEVCVPCELRQ